MLRYRRLRLPKRTSPIKTRLEPATSVRIDQRSYLALQHWRSPYFVKIFVRGRQSEVMKPYAALLARDHAQVTIQPGIGSRGFIFQYFKLFLAVG